MVGRRERRPGRDWGARRGMRDKVGEEVGSSMVG
jgi:hypothetical protein